MWLGLDDTDSLLGGCTTLVFHQLLEHLPCKHGEPRLTRLWPFANRRTRGNAALSVELFCGEEIIPWLDDYWKSNIEPLAGKIGESEHSDRKQYPADPGMVLFEKQPDEIHYWNAVRGEVSYIEGGIQWGGHGRIGAAASCSWKASNATWEGIAWTNEERYVSDELLTKVTELDGTFLCRDPRTSRGLISPRGNSPILFGVRAINQDIATIATNILLEDCSNVIGHRIFKTNQSTGDHIEREYIHNVENIEIKKGGHVIINNNIICFSDSGDMNILCQWLEFGDEISCIGLEYEGKLHLEGVRVINSVSKLRPMCKCGTRMKSMGKNQGSRCPKCKTKSSNNWELSERIPPFKDWVQPPYDKRRHLAEDLSSYHKS